MLENEDGSLNFPKQSALPGEEVVVYATGASGLTQIHIELDNEQLTVPAKVTKSSKYFGVQLVSFKIPENFKSSEGVLHSLRLSSESGFSNIGTISISEAGVDNERKVDIEKGIAYVLGE